MIRVILESPFAGATTEDRAENLAYARRAMRDCLIVERVGLTERSVYRLRQELKVAS